MEFSVESLGRAAAQRMKVLAKRGVVVANAAGANAIAVAESGSYSAHQPVRVLGALGFRARGA